LYKSNRKGDDEGRPTQAWKRRYAMLTVAERKLFRPNAVFIPVKGGKEGRDFDCEDCGLSPGTA